MTKDELNEILKEDGMQLATFRDGTRFKAFNITDGENGLLAKYTGIEFIWNSEHAFSQRVVKALADYANTPTEERKPKPQLYNIIIAKDIHNRSPYLTAWRKVNKLGEYFVTDATEQHDLLHDNDFKFTIEEIEDLKSKVSEKQKQIIDIGTVKIEDTMSTGIDIDEVEDDD
ncbi:hypothetical protein [Pediococcus pentosaceus]|uniref:hypothetical protein n=1 Tax=Pediococcus pentosaceus TaxID=1255 RepID=UPI0018FEC5FD|nr:hypothetical protein [Pediococcus pentosaceus]MBF7122782.1 hypothetical protein [Pediococcus pentosaceus]